MMNVRAAVSVADGLMRQSFYYHLQRLTIRRPGHSGTLRALCCGR